MREQGVKVRQSHERADGDEDRTPQASGFQKLRTKIKSFTKPSQAAVAVLLYNS